MSGTQTVRSLLGPDKSKLGRVEVEAADWGVLMNSGNNEMMKQGSFFWGGSPAHPCII